MFLLAMSSSSSTSFFVGGLFEGRQSGTATAFVFFFFGAFSPGAASHGRDGLQLGTDTMTAAEARHA